MDASRWITAATGHRLTLSSGGDRVLAATADGRPLQRVPGLVQPTPEHARLQRVIHRLQDLAREEPPADASSGRALTPWVMLRFAHPQAPEVLVERRVPQSHQQVEIWSWEAYGFALSAAEPADDAPAPQPRPGLRGHRAVASHPQAARALVAALAEARERGRLRPGHANEVIMRAAGEVPERARWLLAPFFDDAATLMASGGHSTLARAMVDHARAHDSEVEHHDLAVAHWAIAGVLSHRALHAEAGSLAEQCAPLEAYARFRDLVVARTRAGVGAYAELPDDLQRLRTAAGVDDERELLATLLSLPAIAESQLGFWQRCAPQIAGHPELQRLLVTTPAKVALTDWLDVWEAAGALEVARALPECLPALMTVATQQRYMTPLAETRFLPLVAALAPAAARAGVGVRITKALISEVDAVDILLAEGVPVEFPPEPRMLLLTWTQRRRERPDTSRDLSATAAHPQLEPALRAEIERRSKTRDEVTTLLSAPATRAIMLDLAHRRTAEAVTRGLTHGAMRRLDVEAPSWGAVDDPEFAAIVAPAQRGYAPAAMIAATLNAGLTAELAWPAYERALPLVAEGSQVRASLACVWPGAVLHGDRRAFWLAGDQCIEIDLGRLELADEPQRQRLTDVLPVGNDVRVQVWPPRRLVWASTGQPSPGPVDDWTSTTLPTPAGRLHPHGLIRPGSHARLLPGQLFTDGTTFWSRTPDGGLRTLDPRTGQPGRAELPAWFAEQRDRFAADGWRLRLEACQLLPVTPGTAGSWASTAEGFHRVAAFDRPDDPETGLLVDAFGAAYPVPAKLLTPGVTLVARPGGGLWVADKDRLLTRGGSGAYNHIRKAHERAHGPMWHHLRPRDQRVSQRLRTITPADVASLVGAAAAVRGPLATRLEDPALRAAAADCIRSTDPVFVDAVASVALDAGIFASKHPPRRR